MPENTNNCIPFKVKCTGDNKMVVTEITTIPTWRV